MLPIARAAQQAGHEVVIATGPDLAPHVEQLGFPAWPVGRSSAEDFAASRAAQPSMATLPFNERIQAAVSNVFVPGAAKRATDLVPRAMEWKPDVVIHDMTELAGAVAAARSGARHIVHSFGLPVPAWRRMLSPPFELLCAGCGSVGGTQTQPVSREFVMGGVTGRALGGYVHRCDI